MCKANLDPTFLPRLFECEGQIALIDYDVDDFEMHVPLPRSTLLALRYPKKIPKFLRLWGEMLGPNYDCPEPVIKLVIKVQECSLEDIFKRKLFFFLPYYVFRHEKNFTEYEKDASKLQVFVDEYRLICEKIENLQKSGELELLTAYIIFKMITHVIILITDNYPNVKKAVWQVMNGKVLELEGVKLWEGGIVMGRIKEREELKKKNEKERSEEKEEMAKEMIRDKMELSLVEKYTHLSLQRIQELAAELWLSTSLS